MPSTLIVREKEFYRKVIGIGVPVVLQSLITIGINMMDTVMLGSLSGAQISASALANQITHLFQIICLGFGFGTAVMTSQYWGRGDLDSMKKVITIMLRWVIILGGIITAFVAIFPYTAMRIFTPDTEVIEYGIRYFKYLLPTFLMLGVSLTATIVLRSTGSVRIPLVSSIISFFLNVFFNWVFIFGNLGAPRMEIGGAALGTLIARTFELCFIFGYFILKDKNIGYRIRDFFVSAKGFGKEFVRFAVPVVISDALIGLGLVLQSVIIGHISSVFVAANAIAAIVFQFSITFGQGVSNASSVITGHALGEGKEQKAYSYGSTFLIIGFLLGIFSGLILFILAPYMGELYNISEETKHTAKMLMYAMSTMSIFQMLSMILTKGVLRGGGDTRFLLVADIVFLWLVTIPLGAIAGLVLNLSPFWVYICLRLDNILKCIICFKRFFSKRWIKKVT